MSKKYIPDLVSVIIPTYNSENFLPQAINSVLTQTYSKVELIVVNDGSTDNTQKAINPYRNKLLYLYKENGGPGSARNFGIEKSQGEYIAFLDADDYWLPEKLKTQVRYLKNHRNFALIHSNTWILEENKELYPRFINKLPPIGKFYQKLFLQNCINNLTVILKRECFDAVGGFDESEALIGFEDYDLWLRIASNYEIGYFDEIVAVYRVHPRNISSESKAIKSQIFLMEKFKNTGSGTQKLSARLFLEKEQKIYFRWACNLIENKKFNEAYEKFLVAASGKCFKISSLVGAFSCRMKTNFFTKSWISSIRFKRYGDYMVCIQKFNNAEYYYLKSIQNFAIQTIAYKQLFQLYLRKLQRHLFTHNTHLR